MKRYRSARLLSLFVVIGFLFLSGARAEYYSYVDSSGTIHFVDDVSKIPKKYRQKKQVRKDAYDDLPEEQRALLLEKERLKRAEDRNREREQQEKARLRRTEEERRTAEERLKRELTTPVVIAGRQVFVPVRLQNGSAVADVMLLLDTGASTSVITPEVAQRLNIEQHDNVRIGVVGGRVMNARRVVLTRMEVGPIRKANQEAVIVRQRSGEFGDGLLGMSFLAGLKYTIDFNMQTLNWLR